MTNAKIKPSQTSQLSWAINYFSTDVLNFSTFLWGWPTYWFMSKFCLLSWGWNFLCSSTGNELFFLPSPRLCTPPNLKEFKNDESFHSIFSDFSTDTILPGGTAMIPWHWSFSVSEKWWYIVPLLWAVAVLAVVLILRHLTTGGAWSLRYTKGTTKSEHKNCVAREDIGTHNSVTDYETHSNCVATEDNETQADKEPQDDTGALQVVLMLPGHLTRWYAKGTSKATTIGTVQLRLQPMVQ